MIPITHQKELNAHLPYTFEDYFKNYEPIIHTEISQKSPSSTTWDLSEVDISYIDPSKKLISFTFDDAPSKTMENILAVFAEYNEKHPDCRATATFFVNSSLVCENSLPLLHTAHILGMELGNHTHSHFDLTTLSKEQLKEEIDKTEEILSRVDGNAQHLFRAPFGKINESVKEAINVPLIDWTIDTLDWTNVSEDSIYNQVWEGRFDGGIVLMHDGYPHTVSALKRLLPALKKDGYQVVNISAMAKAHNCILKPRSVYIRLRKH